MLNFKGGGCPWVASKWHSVCKNCKLLCRKAVSLPSWDYFVVLLPLPFVFYFLHPPTVSVPESFLLLHFHKHNLCSLDQSVMLTRPNIIEFLNNYINYWKFMATFATHAIIVHWENNDTGLHSSVMPFEYFHGNVHCVLTTNITMIIKIKWIKFCSRLSLCFIDGHTDIS